MIKELIEKRGYNVKHYPTYYRKKEKKI